jgi:tetratricopeptide (TPR) repeat protein
MALGSPRVFLSYSHDSPEHKAAVLTLAKQLRDDGCNTIIDQEHPWVREGWTLWMINQIRQADFVLVICSEAYKRRAEGNEEPPAGPGASWEGAIIRLDLYEANGRNDKFIPVLLHPEDKIHRPLFLRDYSYFVATEPDGYRNLSEVLKADVSKRAASASIWNIPTANAFFSGREEYLETLHNIVTTTGQPTALTQAIKGLGGMGKTQTALKYADLRRAEYTSGFFAVADSRESLVSGFAEFARLLNLPEKDDKDIAKAATAARRWLESRGESWGRWLLILDGVEDWAVARAWLPTGKSGHVLITTRLHFSGTFAHGLELPKMSVEEGAKFLLERSKIETPSDADVRAAKTICQEFDGLPLGLEQAGAYVEEANLSPAEYLELYREAGKKLRARKSMSTDHETVTVTFTLAFEKLDELAREIVRMSSFLAPAAIPEAILTGGKEPDLEFRDAVADSARFSLIHRNRETKTLDIHRVVQEVVKDGMDPASQRLWVERSADAVGKAFPEEVEFRNWTTCERLLPHARAVATKVLEWSIESAKTAYLLHQTAWYLDARGQYKDAEPLIQRELAIRERVSGPDHPDTAKSLNNVARICVSQGQYKDAESLYRRALEINEKALGPDHLDTAKSLNNLATLYHRKGQYREAEPLCRRALEINERVLGLQHPSTAGSLNNLAVLYHRLGRHKDAESLYRRALAINEEALGPEHPDIATNLANLAMVQRDQGRYKDAEPLYRRALEIREKALGPEHPDTALSLNNLAALYLSQGRYQEVESLDRRALEIRQRTLGPDHPDTTFSLNNLAGVYKSQAKYQDAESLYRRALEINEKALGPDHPDIAAGLNNLAGVYMDQWQPKKAETLYRRALEIREKAVGPDHPDTATSLNNLAVLCDREGKHQDAETLYRRALEIREKTLGPDHPDTAASLNCIAGLYKTQGQYQKAEPLYRRALAINEEALGPDHPDTANIVNNLAAMRNAQKQHEDAESLYRRALEINERVLGPDHPATATSLGNLGAFYAKRARFLQAVDFLRRALAVAEKAFGIEHPQSAALARDYSRVLQKVGRGYEAHKLRERFKIRN